MSSQVLEGPGRPYRSPMLPVSYWVSPWGAEMAVEAEGPPCFSTAVHQELQGGSGLGRAG